MKRIANIINRYKKRKTATFFLIKGALFASFFIMTFHIPSSAGESLPKIKVIQTVPGYGAALTNLKDVTLIIEFNREMDPSIQEDVVLDQRGVTDKDGNGVEIKGKITWPNPKTLQFQAEESLKPNATYQLSLFSVRTPEGEEMEVVPYRLVFTTNAGK